MEPNQESAQHPAVAPERHEGSCHCGAVRFQVALDRMGVTAALEKAGAAPGDTVRIGDAEFEYQP